MKPVVVFLIALIGATCLVQAQAFNWVVQNETSLVCSSRALAYGLDGEILNGGHYQGIIDLDPGPGIYADTSVSTTSDVYLQKLDSNGVLVWAKTWRGSGNEDLKDMAVDAQGNIYLTGNFPWNFDADPGPNVLALQGFGTETFVIKLDAGGNLLWAISTENQNQFGQGETVPGGITLDGNGDLIVVGSFKYAVDFDPSMSSDTLENVSNGGQFANCFLWKIDPLGNHLDAMHTISAQTSIANRVRVDNQGNTVIVGSFSGTGDFSHNTPGGLLTSTPFSDGYVQKLDLNGNLIWAWNLESFISHVEIDALDNIYFSGSFGNTVDFDPGPGTHNLTSIQGNADAYLAKWDANGNFVWVGQFGGVGLDGTRDFHLLPNGNVYVLGSFLEGIDLDPGPGMVSYYALGEHLFFVALDSNGIYQSGWVLDITDPNPVRSFQLAVDEDGDFAIAGDFAGTIDFDPTSSVDTLSALMGVDGFVAQWSDTSMLVNRAIPRELSISIYPNPNTGQLNISSPLELSDVSLKIYNLQGKLSYQQAWESLQIESIRMPLPAGLYFAEIISQEIEYKWRMLVE